MGKIILKPGRERSLIRQHPWIFSGAVQKTENVSQPGETVDIISADGNWLARGAYSPYSKILIRIWTFDTDELVNPTFLFNRLQQAFQARQQLFTCLSINAYRLVNSESDGLPGLIVDRYRDFLVCQFLSAGSEFWKTEIVTQLQQLIDCTGIYERSDVIIRNKEGLKPVSGVLWGEAPPDLIKIQEGDLRFLVDIKDGHKTGFYLDQRENRMAMAEFARRKTVLNCFAYTGGFGLWALHGDAEWVLNVESSASLLELARKNIELNRFDPNKIENIEGDVFQELRQFRDKGRKFDIIILDPPKFAESVSQVLKASRGYKDINLLAFKLLKPGGILFTFSCSGHVSLDLFQKIISDAALDAGREAQIVRYLSQAADHPIALTFPEGRYLKGLICRVW